MATCVVSGSASGIGAATRERLQSDGHRVIGIDLRDADGEADLSTADGREAAIRTTLKKCEGRIDKLVRMGFFQDSAAAKDYVRKLEALHQDPARADLAWLLGVDGDLMNEDVRLLEGRNWIKHLVLPNMHSRRVTQS